MSKSGNEANTVLMHHILNGYNQDQVLQVKEGLRDKTVSVNKLQKRLNAEFPSLGKSILSQGSSFGRKILDGQELPKTAAKTTKESLDKTCKYLLQNLGAYPWPNVKKAIQDAGPAYAYLLEMAPIGSIDKVHAIKATNVGEFSKAYPGLPLSDVLKRLSEDVKILESTAKASINQRAEAEQTIIQMANQHTKDQIMLKKMAEAIKRLEALLNDQMSDKDRKEIEDAIKEARRIVNK